MRTPRILLADGTEVPLPPHLGTQLVYAVKPGDLVTIHGLRARAIAMVLAMSVSNSATGTTVTDNGPAGPPGLDRPRQPLTARGQIQAQLHGPRSELNGPLPEDCTIVRLPPAEAERLAYDLVTGAPLYVQGNGLAGPLGRVVEARGLGPSPTQRTHVAAPPPPAAGWPPPGGIGLMPPSGPDAPPPPEQIP